MIFTFCKFTIKISDPVISNTPILSLFNNETRAVNSSCQVSIFENIPCRNVDIIHKPSAMSKKDI